ncbi:MAG: MFS transporter [Hydrogenophaga sp.]|nr:MFS transporter [Hydrogenophaga sp.]
MTSTARDLPIRSWLIWLTAIACLPPLGLNVLVPLDAALRDALQLTAFQGQAAIALYVLGLAIGQPLAGIGADRWGRRRTLLAGLLVGMCGGAAAAAATDAATLLAGRCLTGLGLSVVLVVPRATLRDLCSGAPLQRGMATISVAFALMPAVAPVLGWWLLVQGGGWRVALGLVPLLVAMGGAVALWRHVETRPAGTTLPGWDTLPVLWRHRTPRWVAMGFAAISSVFFLLIAQGPAALRESVGLDGRAIAWVLGGTYLGFLAGSLWAMRQSRHTSGLVLCHWGGGLAGLGVVVIVACAVWPSPLAWIVGMLIYSTGHGLIFPSALGVVMQALPTRAGMAAAFTGMLQMAVGAVVSGGAALLPGSATQRTAAVAALMVGAGVFALLAAHRSAHTAGLNDDARS